MRTLTFKVNSILSIMTSVIFLQTNSQDQECTLLEFSFTVHWKARAALVKSDQPFDRHAASSNVTAKGSKLVL